MKIAHLLFLSFFAIATMDAKPDTFLFGQDNNPNLVVNNRILAKVNGKAISVIDIMKKMDLLFYRQFPEYTSSVPARFQFYQINWKHILSELIDKELILADAGENKIPLSNGDIRQEMETLFGPNIISNLDKIGMSYEEAWNIVKGDILLRRMLHFKVNSKAMREITPQAIRQSYQEFVKNNTLPEKFVYNVITVRDSNPTDGKKIANKIAEDLKSHLFSLESLKDGFPYGETASISISEEFNHSEKEMSEAYKEIVLKLNSGEISEVTAQMSRAANSMVFRIFSLKEKIKGGAQAFGEVESKLKEELFDGALEKESNSYIKKLRSYFDVQESQLTELTDQEFQPFSMK